MERLPFEGLAAEVVRDAVNATEIETRAQVKASPEDAELRGGFPVGSSGADQLWSFEVDSEVAPLPETPGKLLVAGHELVDVRVLAVGDGTIVLRVRADLGDSVPTSQLSLSAGFVHDALIERLEDAVADGEVEGALVDALLLPDPGENEPDGLFPLDTPDPPTAEEEQARAASRAVEPGLRFTWGPPGTGKTRVLGMAVAEAVERGDRVLVLAHANAAVDVAAARVADRLVGTVPLENGRVLRVGTPHLPIALDRHEVLPDRIVALRRPELVERRDTLAAQRRELSDALRTGPDTENQEHLTGRLKQVRAELKKIEAELTAAEGELIDTASVLVTTLARLVIDVQLWRWPADTLIVDEASMAGLPFVLALATRRASTLSFFGDFRQLPPVAVSDDESARQWFSRDVFELAGVVEAHELGRVDNRLSVLRTQFRMGEQICETVNQLAYEGLLRTDSTARNRAIRLAERWPSPGCELVIVDTSSLGGTCLTERSPDGFSRFAPLGAAFALTLAETMTRDGNVDVGLISPYRAHTALLMAASRGIPRVTAATIHRFQGSERDLVLLDLVDGPDQNKASRLTGTDAELSLRLLNVAASRARGKLVILGDLDFIEQIHPLNSAARLLIECAEEAGAETLDATELLSSGAAGGSDLSRVRWFRDWADASAELGRDLSAATSADLQVPADEFGGRWLGQALGDPDRKVVPILRAPPDIARTADSDSVEVRLLTLGPAPWAIIDERMLWIGSRSAHQPVARVDGASVVTAFRQLAVPDK